MPEIKMKDLYNEDIKAKEKIFIDSNSNHKKISKYNILIFGVVIIQIFVYITSPRQHPIEDYIGVILVGLILFGIGNLLLFIIKKVKK